jgi:hypothetical protein
MKNLVNHVSKLLTATVAFLWVLAIGVGFSTSAPQNRGHDPNRPEAIPVFLTPFGFPYKSLSVPPGPYAFVVINRTGFQALTVYLERMPGNSVDGPAARQEFGGNVTDTSTRIVKGARLTPGTYRLRVEGMPTWVTAIQVR